MKPSETRQQRTVADHLAAVAAPVLIMLMVGSLVFFLEAIGYRGRFPAQIRWTLFWFTVAAVLVSRISIEQGSSYGSLYGLALGAATAIRLSLAFGVQLVALLLLGLIWWCASKLTWDCTVLDDREDASGEGLLHHAGLDPPPSATAAGVVVPEPAGIGPAIERGMDPVSGRFRAPPGSRPHAPGLWVLYFSLGALPIFGLGQLAIPAANAAGRAHAFLLLVLYVAAALGLLLITSFLGLRRYLRQRYLVMPPSMAGAWFTLGATLVAVVLAGALVLPRPQGEDTLVRVWSGLRDLPQHASRHSVVPGNAAEGQGTPGSDSSPNDTGKNRDEGDQASARSEGGDRDSEPAERQDHDRRGGGRGSQDAPGARQDARTSARTETPRPLRLSPTMPTAFAMAWLRWIPYAIAAALVVGILIRFGRQGLAFLGRARSRKTREPAPTPRATLPAFMSFRNPFQSGRAGEMTPAELTAYTYSALEAWARDRGWGRRLEQTPAEFGDAVADRAPDWEDDVRKTVRLYVRLAYAGVAPGRDALPHLERLWTALSSQGQGVGR